MKAQTPVDLVVKSGPDTVVVEIKVVGQSGQISLGKQLAGKTLRLERRADGTMLLTAVALVPESQLWTTEDPHRSQIARALDWAAKTPARETDLETLVKLRSSAGRAPGKAAPQKPVRGRRGR